MRSPWMAGAALVALAACSGAGAGGTEEQLAAKIVDAQGVLSLDSETLEQVIGAQLQGLSMQYPDLTPEQQVKLSTAIRAQIDTAMPDLKKQMAGFLTENFEQQELKTYFDFVGSTEGDSIKNKIPAVMEMSVAAADAMTMKAVSEALKAEGIEKAAAPGPAAAPVPAATPEPARPQ